MTPILLSPDSLHYLRAAEGLAVPHPYRLRWLLPRLLGPHPERWRTLTRLSLAWTPLAAVAYFASRGLADAHVAFAAALLCALPALRLPARLPVLTDAPAFAMALLCAALAPRHPWAAALLSLPLGAARETAPLFAAIWSWSPVPLVGILAAGWWRPAADPSPAEPWLVHPWREAWALRRRVGLDADIYLRPWGAALLGLVPTWQVAATVALAHVQLLVAVDTLRLTVWCAPVLAFHAAAIPPAWWALALVVTAVHCEARA